jgi:hypothetical protein
MWSGHVDVVFNHYSLSKQNLKEKWGHENNISSGFI